MKRSLLVAVVVAALVAGACGGKSDHKNAASKDTTTSAAGLALYGGTGTSGGSSTTASPSATTGKGGAATATTASNKLKTSTGGTVAPSATVKPPAPGVYMYDNTGTSSQPGGIPPTTKVTFSAPQGARQQSVGEEKDSSGNGTTTTQVLEYRDAGLYLVALNVENKSAFTTLTFDFSPPAPVLFAPLPATPGKAWTVDLTSSDGCYTAHADAKVLANNVAVPAAGASQTTDQIETTTHIKNVKTGGNCAAIDLNQDQTIWYSEQYRLSVKLHTTSTGTAYGFQVNGDETSVLKSTTPA